MAAATVRTTLDIPAALYRELEKQAAAEGCSTADLILRGMEKALMTRNAPQTRRVQFPLIKNHSPKVNLTNDQIY